MYVVRMCRAAVPHLKARGGGSVLNITAISAIQPIGGFGLSVATWDAVIGYAKTLSLELAASGINVNTICPGYIETKRLEKSSPPAARTQSHAGGAYRTKCRCGASARSTISRALSLCWYRRAATTSPGPRFRSTAACSAAFAEGEHNDLCEHGQARTRAALYDVGLVDQQDLLRIHR